MSTTRPWLLRNVVLFAAAGALVLSSTVASAGPFSRKSKSSGTFSMEDVEAAKKAGDSEALRGFCQKPKKFTDAWKAACQAMIDDAAAKGEGEFLLAICRGKKREYHSKFYKPACKAAESMSSGAYEEDLKECANVPKTYEKYRADLDKKAREAMYFAIGTRAAECGQWDYIWTGLVHQGDLDVGRGVTLLGKLADAGHDVEAELMKYLAANKDAPFAYKQGRYATNHALKYLEDAKKVGKCERFIPYAKKAPDENAGQWIGFFARTGCAKAAPLAVAQLRSESSERRSQACAVLGKIGSKKDIPKLSSLATKDPTYKVVRLNKIYWVRDACAKAIADIELRQ